MKLEKVIAITGKPGLYEIISQSKGGIIVESLSDKKRFPVNSLQVIYSPSIEMNSTPSLHRAAY